MSTVRDRRQRQCRTRQRVHIGPADSTLTPHAGLIAITELADHLDVATTLDAGIGPVKQRGRGITGGELLVSLASCQMAGGITWFRWTGCVPIPSARNWGSHNDFLPRFA